MKRKFSDQVRSKTPTAQINEALLTGCKGASSSGRRQDGNSTDTVITGSKPERDTSRTNQNQPGAEPPIQITVTTPEESAERPHATINGA